MEKADVRLIPLQPEDREQFILDNQWAFKCGAQQEAFFAGEPGALPLFMELNERILEGCGAYAMVLFITAWEFPLLSSPIKG